MDNPRNANFRSPIRMHNVLATGFDVSTKNKIGKEDDMSDMVCKACLTQNTVGHTVPVRYTRLYTG